MSPAVIQLIIALAPYGIQVVLALIGLLESALNAGHTPDTLTGVSTAILDGIVRDHPEWPAEQQQRYAVDAIAQWTKDHAPAA